MLTPKQRKFVSEYLVDQNGTQAAIRAGYSPKTANVQASDLLAKPNIRSEVDAALAKHAENAGLTLERHLRDLERLREEAAAAEQFGAAVSAETSRGKASGLYVEKVQHSGQMDVTVNFRRAK